ncbi:MAG TPA: hypothetical protein VK338_04960, partial [Candidatus Nitrosocosmicus sp.]|nr:hypothetical protein [Candidatus Nitrosocosmicus sp.]
KRNPAIILVIVLVLLLITYSLFRSNNAKTDDTLINDENPGNTTANIGPTEKQVGNVKFFLTITEPQNNASVTESVITVRGKTVPDAEVFVNEKELLADKQGEFTVDLELVEGENEIQIFANDALGNVQEQSRTVTYTPSQ